jgi:glycyl-tRNA synthetase beta chain
MTMNQTLLVEFLTEELPPKALAKLGEAFANGIANGLKSRDFLEADSVATAFATPRRLAVSITKVRAASPDKSIREKILPVSVALDASGNATAPLGKKLAALGFPNVCVSELERATDGKAESFFYTYTAKGSSLHQGLQAALDEAVTKLPIPKVMSYQRPDGSTVQFVRPVHKLIVLHGADVLPIAILGLAAGRTTLGHRFLAPGELAITQADSYAAVLETQGKVIASVSTRKEKIRAALQGKAGGDQVLMPESLLDEVTALVEWPVVYECHFEQEFLSVPQECLILTMQTNQKYFALTDAHGKLRSRFLIASNIETADPQHIIGGNERVVRPRLADAKFFFEQDKKKKLEDRLGDLAKVVYHNQLGSQGDRVERVRAIAKAIGKRLGGDALAGAADTAAKLAKADLLTDMVGEFPELQGIMGGYYARHDGLSEDIAFAIEDHYKPRFAGDALPRNLVGVVVALADKLDTLNGLFSIGQVPTGDKDPFALRRHALGVIRMLTECDLNLTLDKLIAISSIAFADASQGETRDAAMNLVMEQGYAGTGNDKISLFIFDRLSGSLREQGYNAQEVDAVVSQRPQRLGDVPKRLDAVRTFLTLPEAESLAAANKRITNILKKTDGVTHTVQKGLLIETAEESLYSAMTLLKPEVDAAFAQGDFPATLKLLARLRNHVDVFFTDVMVMAEDTQLRNNRIALLSELRGMLNQVADISKLAS